jgi:hypothetical protein
VGLCWWGSLLLEVFSRTKAALMNLNEIYKFTN